MAEISDSRKPVGPGRCRRWLRWTIRGVIAFVVIVILVFTIWSYLAARALNRKVESLRAAGEPVTFAQLAKHAEPLPPERNGGPYYNAAIELAVLAEDSREVQEALTKIVKAAASQPDPQALQSAQECIRRHDNILRMLDHAASLPVSNHDLGLSDGIGVVLPKLSRARTLARLLSAQTRLLALEARPEAAVDSSRSHLRLTRIFEDQPVLIAHLVRLAILALAMEDVETVLAVSRPSVESLQALRQALLEAEQAIDMPRVWKAERVYTVELARNLLSNPRALAQGPDWRPPMPEALPGWTGWGPFVRRLMLGTLERHEDFIAAAGLDWPQQLAAMQAYEQAPQPLTLSRMLFADLLSVPAHRVTLQTARMVAQLRAARIATLVELYQRARGELPQSLKDLAVATGEPLPADPFTGEPLLYQRDAAGYSVVSEQDGTPVGVRVGSADKAASAPS